ncbi:MAG: Ribosomal protein S5 [Candidatus Alkanophagales archaeon MCA70_species_2]|nr:Ribosomal protein S5 [Candidatus Alkanophaga liquidiphilum]
MRTLLKRWQGMEEHELEAWEPRTRLGKLVKEGKIKTIEEALKSEYPLKEIEIVDYLLPDLDEEVLDISLVQRMTDSGRRTKFRVCVAVGNRDGYVGVGLGKDSLVGDSIVKAVRNAKLNLIYVERGCGSWECTCGGKHSVPFTVTGQSGSVRVTLKPAPKGLGIAAGKTQKKVLELAGIRDVWTFSMGETRTTFNTAKATLDALKKTTLMRV